MQKTDKDCCFHPRKTGGQRHALLIKGDCYSCLVLLMKESLEQITAINIRISPMTN